MAVYTVALKRWPSKLPPLSFMAVIATIGTVILVPAMIVEGGFAFGWERYIQLVGAITYIGVISGAAAYALWNESVVRNGANMTALFLYSQPAFAVACCWLFLKQRILTYHWQGIVYLEQRAKPTGELLYQQWTAGYLYGMSANSASLSVVPPDLPTMIAWLDKWCRDNPLSNVASGVGALAKQLLRK